jgi:hypothetical protein
MSFLFTLCAGIVSSPLRIFFFPMGAFLGTMFNPTDGAHRSIMWTAANQIGRSTMPIATANTTSSNMIQIIAIISQMSSITTGKTDVIIIRTSAIDPGMTDPRAPRTR